MTNISVNVGEIEAGRGGRGRDGVDGGETEIFECVEACMSVVKQPGESGELRGGVEDRGGHTGYGGR